MRKILTYKNFLLILIMLFLLLPVIQNLFSPFHSIKKLEGVYTTEKPIALSVYNWLDRSFQEQEEKVINQQFGLRDLAVRINNQLDYSLFSIIHVGDVLQGKSNYLFSVKFSQNYTGKTFEGEAHVDSVVLELKKINNWLNAKNKKMLVCIAPCKESFYPELLPDSVSASYSKKNYYNAFVKKYQENNIPLIDFNKLFLQMKDTSTSPLFMAGAVHWTTYGGTYALDTLLKRVRYEINKPVNLVKTNSIAVVDTPRGSDNDIEKAMNILFDLNKYPYAYPQLSFMYPMEKSYKPKVLIIGDSFYYTLNNTWIPLQAFSDESYFLYYFRQGIPYNVSKPDISVDKMNLPKEIENTDIIILFGSIGTMDTFPYGFCSSSLF